MQAGGSAGAGLPRPEGMTAAALGRRRRARTEWPFRWGRRRMARRKMRRRSLGRRGKREEMEQLGAAYGIQLTAFLPRFLLMWNAKHRYRLERWEQPSKISYRLGEGGRVLIRLTQRQAGRRQLWSRRQIYNTRLAKAPPRSVGTFEQQMHAAFQEMKWMHGGMLVVCYFQTCHLNLQSCMRKDPPQHATMNIRDVCIAPYKL